MAGLYFIYDDVGDCLCTDIFKCKNEKVALLGFQSFVHENVSKHGLSLNSYSLYRCGSFDDETLSIVDTERVEICTGDLVYDKLVALGVLTVDAEDLTEQAPADKNIVLDNGEI